MNFPLKNVYIFGKDLLLDTKTMTLGQNFGENYLDKYKEWGLKGHNGKDWPCHDSEPVYAAHDGIVYRLVTESVVSPETNTRGLGIYIRDKDLKDEKYLTTIYWHLKEFKVQIGDSVNAGDLIALADNTGMSTGSHLHFGVKYLDKNLFTINTDNGYDGYVDPLPLFKNMTVNQEELNQLYLAVFGRLPDDAAQGYVGHELLFVLNELMKSAEYQAYAEVLEAIQHRFNVKI